VARVFVDTNVLFPFSVMDLMLALTEDGVHEVLWTDALLDEWERVIVRQQRRSPDSAANITTAIRDYFVDSQVAVSSYAHLVDDMPSGDPDDRHHIAAAVAGNAELIITWNRGDLPAEHLQGHELAETLANAGVPNSAATLRELLIALDPTSLG